jgi:hypothetical protein
MVCFQTKNPNLGKFWRVLAYFMTIWSILRPLKIFYDHSVYFVVIWYIFPVLVSCSNKNLATLEARLKTGFRFSLKIGCRGNPPLPTWDEKSNSVGPKILRVNWTLFLNWRHFSAVDEIKMKNQKKIWTFWLNILTADLLRNINFQKKWILHFLRLILRNWSHRHKTLQFISCRFSSDANNLFFPLKNMFVPSKVYKVFFLRGLVIPFPVGFCYRQIAILLRLLGITIITRTPR